MKIIDTVDRKELIKKIKQLGRQYSSVMSTEQCEEAIDLLSYEIERLNAMENLAFTSHLKSYARLSTNANKSEEGGRVAFLGGYAFFLTKARELGAVAVIKSGYLVINDKKLILNYFPKDVARLEMVELYNLDYIKNTREGIVEGFKEDEDSLPSIEDQYYKD